MSYQISRSGQQSNPSLLNSKYQTNYQQLPAKPKIIQTPNTLKYEYIKQKIYQGSQSNVGIMSSPKNNYNPSVSANKENMSCLSNNEVKKNRINSLMNNLTPTSKSGLLNHNRTPTQQTPVQNSYLLKKQLSQDFRSKQNNFQSLRNDRKMTTVLQNFQQSNHQNSIGQINSIQKTNNIRSINQSISNNQEILGSTIQHKKQSILQSISQNQIQPQEINKSQETQREHQSSKQIYGQMLKQSYSQSQSQHQQMSIQQSKMIQQPQQFTNYQQSVQESQSHKSKKFEMIYEKCVNHPNKKGKYKIAGQANGPSYCSKCSISMIPHTNMEENRNLDRQKQIDQMFALIEDLQLESLSESINIKESDIQQYYKVQQQHLNQVYDNIIAQAQQFKSMKNNQLEQELQNHLQQYQVEKLKVKEIHEDTQAIEYDITNHLETIIKNFDYAKFCDIIQNYYQRCQWYKNQLDEVRKKEIKVSKINVNTSSFDEAHTYNKTKLIKQGYTQGCLSSAKGKNYISQPQKVSNFEESRGNQIISFDNKEMFSNILKQQQQEEVNQPSFNNNFGMQFSGHFKQNFHTDVEQNQQQQIPYQKFQTQNTPYNEKTLQQSDISTQKQMNYYKPQSDLSKTNPKLLNYEEVCQQDEYQQQDYQQDFQDMQQQQQNLKYNNTPPFRQLFSNLNTPQQYNQEIQEEPEEYNYSGEQQNSQESLQEKEQFKMSYQQCQNQLNFMTQGNNNDQDNQSMVEIQSENNEEELIEMYNQAQNELYIAQQSNESLQKTAKTNNSLSNNRYSPAEDNDMVETDSPQKVEKFQA